jgi:hypothetical protein
MRLVLRVKEEIGQYNRMMERREILRISGSRLRTH